MLAFFHVVYFASRRSERLAHLECGSGLALNLARAAYFARRSVKREIGETSDMESRAECELEALLVHRPCCNFSGRTCKDSRKGVL